MGCTVFQPGSKGVRGVWRKPHDFNDYALFTQYFSGDEIARNKMVVACSANGGE